jgi:hypothetical protein
MHIGLCFDQNVSSLIFHIHHLSLPQIYPASRLHWPLRNKAAAQLIPLPPHSLGTIANEAAHQGMFAAVGDDY